MSLKKIYLEIQYFFKQSQLYLMSLKAAWTQEEDTFLKEIVRKRTKVNWSEVKELFKEKFPNKIQRTALQCRERYNKYSQYSQPEEISEMKWHQGEADILFNQFLKCGPRWNLISKALPLKSVNSIKNKFYGGLRKTVRRMNHIGQSEGKRLKKKLKYESVIRIIEAPQCIYNLDDDLKQKSIKLREKFVELMRLDSIEDVEKNAYEIICEINKFNLLTRSYKSKRAKKQINDHSCGHCQYYEQNQLQSLTGLSRKGKIEGQDQKEELEQQKNKKSKDIDFEGNQALSISSESKYSPVLKEINEPVDKNNVNEDEYLLEIFPEKASPLEGEDLL